MESDLYAILGLTSSATPGEVKKRYRTLARQYHPDVNSNPDASHKIKELNSAYEVLGDAEKRALYDAEKLLNQRTTPQTPPPPQQPSPPPKPSPNSAPKQETGFTYDGFGRTTPKEPPTATKAEPPKQRPKPPPPLPRAEPFLEEARLAYVNKDFRAAEQYCQQVLGIDAKNASAYEMLGDICMKRGQRDRALTCYTYAIQHNPNHLGLREKLERASGSAKTGRATRPIVTRRRASLAKSLISIEKRDGVITGLVVLLFASLVGMVAWVRIDPGTPFFGEISLNILLGLCVGGLEGGMLLGFLGRMRPMQEETSELRLGKTARMWLFASALVWFYASLIGYSAIAIKRRQISYSLLRAYGITLLFILLFVVAYSPLGATSSTVQLAAFGGNLLFPMLLLGWSLADRIRLR